MKKLVAVIIAALLLCMLFSIAFADDTLILPESVETIEEEAFFGTNAQSAVIPDGTTAIGRRAFGNSALKEISIPASVTMIEEDAFQNCTGLNVTGVEGSYADEWCFTHMVSFNGEVRVPSFPESPHPYTVNMDQTWNYQLQTSCNYLYVAFADECELEQDYDFVTITDGQGNTVGTYTGTELAGKKIFIPGNSFSVRLQADDMVQKYGFRIERIVPADMPIIIENMSVYEELVDEMYPYIVTEATVLAADPQVHIIYQLRCDDEIILEYESDMPVTNGEIHLGDSIYASQNGAYVLAVTVTDQTGHTETSESEPYVRNVFQAWLGDPLTTNFDYWYNYPTLLTLGGTIRTEVTASGGTAPYEYAIDILASPVNYYMEDFGYEDTLIAGSFGADNQIQYKPRRTGEYGVRVRVRDASGEEISLLSYPVIVCNQPSINDISISSEKNWAGEPATVTAHFTDDIYDPYLMPHYWIDIRKDGETVYSASETDGVIDEDADETGWSLTWQYVPEAPGNYTASISVFWADWFERREYDYSWDMYDFDEEFRASHTISLESAAVEITEHGETDAASFTHDPLDSTSTVITGYTGTDLFAVIPKKLDGYYVVGIGENAFSEKENLRGVIMPDTVQTIGDGAFCRCISLKNVTWPTGLINIGNSAFQYCNELTGVTLHNGVETIGDYAFSDCSAIENAGLPDSVINIGVYAFRNCTSLTAFRYPKNLETTGWGIFDDCENLTSVTVPEGVTIIPDDAFSYASGLENIELPSTLLTIGNSAFKDCSSLNSVIYPANLTEIGEYAFAGCTAMEDAELPDSVTTIWARAFLNCTSLTSFRYPMNWTTAGTDIWHEGGIFEGCERLTAITIPEGVTSIPDNAFISASYLDEIELPSTLQAIGSYAFYNCSSLTGLVYPENLLEIGEYAFAECTAMEDAELPDSVTTIWTRAFLNCTSLTSIRYPMNWTTAGTDFWYEGGIFEGCERLTTIMVPEGVTSIPDNAFIRASYLDEIELPSTLRIIGNDAFRNCSSLIDLAFPENLTTIGEYAFAGCTAMENAELPDSVTTIGNRAFLGCTSLIYFRYPMNWVLAGTNYNSTEGALEGCESLTAVTVPEGITWIPDNAFTSASYLEEIELPATLQSIGSYAFYGCSSLVDPELPEGLTEIGGHAFEECTSLTGLVYPENLTTIGEYAFAGCTSMENAELPDNITYIGAGAFQNCSVLTSFRYPKNLTTAGVYIYWGDGIFIGCESLTTIAIPEGVSCIPENVFAFADYLEEIELPSTLTKISSHAFYYCNSLTDPVLPSGLTEVSDYAFAGCTTLTGLVYPENLTTIGEHAFADCTSMENAELPDSITYIGAGAFQNCTALTSFRYPKNWTTAGVYTYWENGIFVGCESLDVITIPEGVTVIPDKAFAFSTYITYIEIPSTLRVIGIEAFYNCTGIQEIDLPVDLTTLQERAFYGCTALENVYLSPAVVEIGEDVFDECESITVYCEDQTTALTYCQQNGINYAIR